MRKLTARLLAAALAIESGACDVFEDDRSDQVPSDDFVLDCDLYCAVIMRRCEGSMAAFYSHEACMDSCAAYPTDGVFGASLGDSLQCRFTFALAVRTHTRHVFCRNAGPTGGVTCVAGAENTPMDMVDLQ